MTNLMKDIGKFDQLFWEKKERDSYGIPRNKFQMDYKVTARKTSVKAASQEEQLLPRDLCQAKAHVSTRARMASKSTRPR